MRTPQPGMLPAPSRKIAPPTKMRVTGMRAPPGIGQGMLDILPRVTSESGLDVATIGNARRAAPDRNVTF
ncbi:hypothetical protein GCM10009739_17090 [Microbacterium ulmi]